MRTRQTPALLCALVDARARIACGALFLPAIAAPITYFAVLRWTAPGTPATFWAWMWIFDASTAVLITVGTLGTRRQARI